VKKFTRDLSLKPFVVHAKPDSISSDHSTTGEAGIAFDGTAGQSGHKD